MSKLFNKTIASVVSLTMVFTLVAVPAHGQTVSELQAQIAALLAQIQQLQAQLNTASEGGSTVVLPAFTRDLTVGSTGTDVENLQTFLKNQGPSIYPEGLVTGYFGSLTKAAVARYQDAHAASVLAPVGLTSGTGYFGPSTRAYVNTQLSTTTPTPTPTAAPTSAPTATPTPVSAAGTVQVSLAAGNPAGTTVVSDSSTDGAQIGIEVLRLQFAAGANSSNGVVTSLSVKRSGISADSDFANAYLYEGDTRLSDTAAVSNGVFTWTNSNGLFTVAPGATRNVSVKVDLSAGTSSGKTFMFSLNSAADVTMSGPSVAGSFPLMGNEFRTATVTDLGKLSTGTVSPTAGTNVDAGTTNYEVVRVPMTAADQDIEVSRIKFNMIGSADYDALQNLTLYVDGQQVGSTVALMNSDRTLLFDLSGAPLTLLAGQTKQVAVRADVVKGSGRTFRFRISEAVDVVARDKGYNVMVKLNQSDVFTIVQAGGDTTISEGSLTVTRASDSASGNVALNANNVKVASFDFKATGEDIKVSTLNLQVVDGATAFTNIENVKLMVGGIQIGTTVSSLAVDTSQAYSAGSSFIIPAGTTKTLDVYADISSASGAGDALQASDTFYVELIQGNLNAIRQSAGTTLNAPGSAVQGNTLTVSSGNVTATKNTSVSNKTVVQSAQNQLIGSWLLTAPQEQSVDVTSITFVDSDGNLNTNGTGGLGDGFDALKLMSGSTQYGQTINSPSATAGTQQTFNLSTPLRLAAGQSVEISLYANVLSNADSTWTDGDAFELDSLTGTGLVTNSSVTLGGAANGAVGQTLTVSAGATLTIANEVSPTMPNSSWLVTGDNGVTLAAWKFSVDNTEDVSVTRIQVRESGTDDLPGNAQNIKLYVNGVQIGSTVPAFTDSTANTALFENTSGLFTVTANDEVTVLVKADITDDTNATFSTDGSDLRMNLNVGSGTATATGNVSAKGATSGQYVTLAAGASADHQGNNFKVVKSRPVFSLCETGGSGCSSVSEGETLVPGTVEVFRFSMTAHSNEDVVFDGTNHNLRFTVTSNPGAASAGTFELFDAATDTSLGTAAAGATVNFTPSTTVPAGTTKTYYVKADLSSWTSTGNSFQLSVKNAAADVSFSDDTTSADLSAANFVGWGLPLDGEVLVKP